MLAGTALVARRFNIAPAILLMLSGVGLAFVPGMPPVELPPELVLLMVLPPLIYSASVAMSWREFRNNLRPIVLLAVGAVIFTAVAGGYGHALCDRPALDHRIPAGRHRRSARRGGAARDRAPSEYTAPASWSSSRARDSRMMRPR